MSTDLQKLIDEEAAMMVRPAFVETSNAGAEGIGADDVRLPRLLIAQGLSDQMIPGNSKYIENLKMFDLFNDVSCEVYGPGPLKFVVVKRLVHAIEFDPTQRGVPLDLNVPLTDERLLWTKDPTTGKGIKPAATKFVEFVGVILNKDGTIKEPIVISIKETNKHNTRAHKALSGYIGMRQPPAPIYAGLYNVSSGHEKNDKGTFGIYVFKNAGFVQDARLYAAAKAMHEGLEGKTVTVAREAGDEEFDPAAMEGQAQDPSGM